MAENYTVETDIIYEGNGTVKEFPITFSFSDENEVVVYLNGEVIRKGYSIDGDLVVFNVAPADGDEIALAKAAVDAPEEEESVSSESSESGSNTVYDQASREHIKINPVPAKVKYSGNGEVTEFPTGFAFFENDNIIVYLNGAIINSGYSITGVGETEGGSVIFDEAPEEGDKIVILRQVAIERVTDFQEGGAFRAKNINDELDRQTAFCQQIQEQIDRCVKVEVTEDRTPEELLAEVYGKLDSATEVAKEAVDAANAATDAVASAEKTLAEVNTYVDESKAEINELITKTTTEIDQTIADATEEIKEAAVAEAEKAIDAGVKAIEDKAAETTEGLDDAVNKARIWAEGEQAEVKPLGGELSSMGAADLAYALANAPEDTPIDTANMFAMNIFKGDKGDRGERGRDGLDDKITNCITEIPQDIKLELNNGTLTLKAGSKVYVPNGKNADGSNKFDEVVISADKSVYSGDWDTGTYAVFRLPSGGMSYVLISNCSSGTAAPSTTSYNAWYDTTNNLVKNYNSGAETSNRFSFPIAIVSSTRGTGTTSIDQVFNGFGYIGSTAFALPGVKGLIPNGRNADGSLKNIEFTTSKVLTKTSSGTYNYKLMVASNTLDNYVSADYDAENNLNSNSATSQIGLCIAGTFSRVDGVITSFQPKLQFRAVDYSDSSWVAQQAMPSGKYIDLTLGASGASYTAPANGWFVVRKRTAAANQGLFFGISNGAQFEIYNPVSGAIIGLAVPAKRGDVLNALYSAGGATEMFRFIYAEGDK